LLSIAKTRRTPLPSPPKIHVCFSVPVSQNPIALTADRIKLRSKIRARRPYQPTSSHCLFKGFGAWRKIEIGSSTIEFIALGFWKSHELEAFAAIQLQQTLQHLCVKCAHMHEQHIRDIPLIKSVRDAPIVVDAFIGGGKVAVLQGRDRCLITVSFCTARKARSTNSYRSSC